MDGAVAAPSADARLAAAGDAALGLDGLALVQEFATPDGGRTYRVWFAAGAVQCAVSVQAQAHSYNACVRSVPTQPWSPPPRVAAAVLRLADAARADCGSVELLFCNGARRSQFAAELLEAAVHV